MLSPSRNLGSTAPDGVATECGEEKTDGLPAPPPPPPPAPWMEPMEDVGRLTGGIAVGAGLMRRWKYGGGP